MRKFSRCVLILLVVTIIAGLGGYFYEKNSITPVYSSTAQLYIVPGEENEASVRASNGGLNNDFTIIFTSNVVITDAQKTLGTTEDISKYLTVSSPANSNIVEIKCVNADQETAKSYVDAVAKTAIKTTSIIPVKSIQILSEGTSTNKAIRPDLYKNTGYIAGIASVICVILEIITVLIINAFKKPLDNSDDEWEYERHYGKYAPSNQDALLLTGNDNSNESHLSKKERRKIKSQKKKTDKFLEGFNPEESDFFNDYDADNNDKNQLEDVFKDTAAGNESGTEPVKEYPDSVADREDIDKQHTRIIDTKAIKSMLSDNAKNSKQEDNTEEDAVDKENTEDIIRNDSAEVVAETSKAENESSESKKSDKSEAPESELEKSEETDKPEESENEFDELKKLDESEAPDGEPEKSEETDKPEESENESDELKKPDESEAPDGELEKSEETDKPETSENESGESRKPETSDASESEHEQSDKLEEKEESYNNSSDSKQDGVQAIDETVKEKTDETIADDILDEPDEPDEDVLEQPDDFEGDVLADIEDDEDILAEDDDILADIEESSQIVVLGRIQR